MIRRIVIAGTLGVLLAGPAAAQSAQRFSIQGSGAMVFPTAEDANFESNTRLGWEAQLRYTFSRFSLGAGYQRATVYKFATGDFSGAVSVGFVEPRYVLTTRGGVALYLAGRVGAGQLVCSPAEDCAPQSMELAYGGGGGLLFRLSSRVSADLGSQYFSAGYAVASGETVRAGYVLVRLGLSVGL